MHPSPIHSASSWAVSKQFLHHRNFENVKVKDLCAAVNKGAAYPLKISLIYEPHLKS